MPRRAGIVLASAYKVRIREDRGVMPDLQFYRAGNLPPSEALTQGAKDLVVEVISPASRRFDRVEKLNWYAAIGVPEYWIVDPESQVLQQLLLEGGVYQVAQALGGEADFLPATFPGLTIPLGPLWSLPEN